MRKVTLLAATAGFAVWLAASPALAAFQFEITEIWSGQAGTDITEDWFELYNSGNMAWTLGGDGALTVNDSSGGLADDDTVAGITSIAPGEVVIILMEGDAAAATTFFNAWNPTKDLTGIQIGYADGVPDGGLGLGGGGDSVNVWVADIFQASASYPDTSSNNAQSWDVQLGTWSTVGNAAGAVASFALGGSGGDTPAIGSPGMIVPEPSSILLASIAGLGLALFARRRMKR